jgi:hypothetical protein
MARNLTMENLRHLSDLAALNFSGEELQRLLPGVNRSKNQAEELRELIKAKDEPAAIFTSSRAEQWK